ncbi:ABC transporter permease [Actinomyces provencensis]|uniref:ABC transporter permease n=1 Tax=Actinomyces provencensis TaxID=1720198 RepID=UPI001E49D6A2|nr:ABC transporter permease [Actinomyces provencensis]
MSSPDRPAQPAMATDVVADPNSPSPGGGTPTAKASSTATRARKGSGALWRYIVTRFLLIIPTVFILITLVFFLMHTIGDPITASLGGRLPADQLAERIHAAGYDRPVIVQYGDYLADLLRGDFGTSLSDNRPVTEIITTYGTATLELSLYALLVAFVVGIPLGMVAAYVRDHWGDAVLRVFAILCYATPVFFSGLLLKLLFGVWWKILPVSGRAATRTELRLSTMDGGTGIYLIDAIKSGDTAALGDVLAHAVLPGLTLGLMTAGVFLRLVRTNMISTLHADYVDAARSRGVSEYRLVRKHAYKPALIPIITVVGMQIAMLLSGAVLTETTFEWKGLGFQLAKYLTARDFVAVQGIVALLAVVVAITNFLVDIIAALIDPRVRY